MAAPFVGIRALRVAPLRGLSAATSASTVTSHAPFPARGGPCCQQQCPLPSALVAAAQQPQAEASSLSLMRSLRMMPARSLPASGTSFPQQAAAIQRLTTASPQAKSVPGGRPPATRATASVATARLPGRTTTTSGSVDCSHCHNHHHYYHHHHHSFDTDLQPGSGPRIGASAVPQHLSASLDSAFEPAAPLTSAAAIASVAEVGASTSAKQRRAKPGSAPLFAGVCVDAFGTLLLTAEPVHVTYSRIAQRHGEKILQNLCHIILMHIEHCVTEVRVLHHDSVVLCAM